MRQAGLAVELSDREFIEIVFGWRGRRRLTQCRWIVLLGGCNKREYQQGEAAEASSNVFTGVNIKPPRATELDSSPKRR